MPVHGMPHGTTVNSMEGALAYLVECNLATVEGLALTKRRGVIEFRRALEIAQRGLTWLADYGCPKEVPLNDGTHLFSRGGRISIVAQQYEFSVEKWANSFDVKRHHV